MNNVETRGFYIEQGTKRIAAWNGPTTSWDGGCSAHVIFHGQWNLWWPEGQGFTIIIVTGLVPLYRDIEPRIEITVMRLFVARYSSLYWVFLCSPPFQVLEQMPKCWALTPCLVVL